MPAIPRRSGQAYIRNLAARSFLGTAEPSRDPEGDLLAVDLHRRTLFFGLGEPGGDVAESDGVGSDAEATPFLVRALWGQTQSEKLVAPNVPWPKSWSCRALTIWPPHS